MIKIPLRSMVPAALLAGVLAASARVIGAEAQTAADGPLQISWEVRNRFRLFREERDFPLHVEARRGRSVLAAEQALGLQSDGRGWARNTVNRLCIDQAGRVSQPCTRDNVKESYLTPTEHQVTVRLTGPFPPAPPAPGRSTTATARKPRRSIAPSRSTTACATAAPRSATVDVSSAERRPSASPPRSRCATS